VSAAPPVDLTDSSAAELARDRGVRLAVTPTDPDHLVSRTGPELLNAAYPPVQWLLEPVLEREGIAMIFGPTGIAKTQLAVALAIAVAAGQPLLGWTCHRAPVVYVDGEMGGRRMQARIGKHLAGQALPKHEIADLHVITRDDQPGGILPNLEDPDAQYALLDSLPAKPGLLILDNLSTLTTMRDSNEAASWQPMQDLLIELKRRHWSSVLLHHSNKGGISQAGTGRREHVMDLVLSLREHLSTTPPDPSSHEIEIHIVKGRELTRDHREPFLATLANPYGNRDRLAWQRGALEGRQRDSLLELLRDGVPVNAVAHQLGLSLATCYRRQKALIASGELKPKSRKTPPQESPRGPD
jgi:hypothetical protein